MIKEAILHNMTREFVYSIGANSYMIKIRTKANDMVIVNLYYYNKYHNVIKDHKVHTVRMTKVATDELFDYYEAIVNVNHITTKYYFELIDGSGDYIYYANYRFLNEPSKDDSYSFDFPIQAKMEDAPSYIDWMADGIVYQIFPDRYYRGDNYIPNKSHTKWSASPKWNSIYGGTIKGITQKLDHIKDLGATIIYLTPIFESPSNHKYNTTDYMKLDPDFGTKEDFKEFVDTAHSKGIKVILDGVFNHSGEDFFPFKDLLKNGQKSDYKDWFFPFSFPVKRIHGIKPNYQSFSYFGGMPKLNTMNQDVQKYFTDMIDYWMTNFNVDGWRLDVADEVSHEFWTVFRKAVKKNKKDAPLIGEIWYDSRDWLQGNEFDCVMNYQFYRCVEQFIARGTMTVSEFVSNLEFVRGNTNYNAYRMLWNLIDSHDCPRFITCAGDDVRKLKLAALLQFTFTGTPMIYYGDEVGMKGKGDPDCRRGMIWDSDKVDTDVLNYYKSLTKLRHSHPCLRRGEFHLVYKDDDKQVLVYKKVYEDETLLVAINNSDTEVTLTSLTNKINMIDNQVMDGVLPPFTGVIMQLHNKL